MALLAAGMQAVPAEPPAFDLPPQIKVEVGAHTGFIKKLAASADGTALLSVSDDRTARVWDARTGRLRRTLRVPIGHEGEGKLAAAALTRDARYALVGGFTGLTRGAESGGVVYIFDTRNGQLVSGIDTNSPFAIENLEFSPDNKVIAICQADGQGVQFYDLQQQHQLHQDLQPKDKILGADFADSGDFALTTVDGWLRVYSAASGYRESRALRLRAGRTPMHVKFSPDSRQLVVGFDGDPVIAIVNAQSLREVRTLRVEDKRQQGLHVVEWSADGAALLAGGETNDPTYTPIYRFALAESTPPRVVATLARRVSDLRRLSNGRFAYSSGEPEVGVMDGLGKLLWRTPAGAVLGDPARDDIVLNADASQVVFRSGTARREWRIDFSRENADVVTSAEATTPASRTDARPQIAVRVGRDGESLSVANRDVRLDHGESVNFWTEDPKHRFVLVGTSWSLRLIDRLGQPLWRWNAPEEALKSTISAEGDVAVTFLADGTLRWTRLDDGAEILAVMMHRNGADWVAWIPDGYYLSSTAGDSLVGWQLNNGMAATPDFYRAVQFERVFYQPDIVKEHFRSLGRKPLPAGSGPRLADLRSIAPPKLSISVIGTANGKARVSVSGTKTALPIRDWTLFVDGIPVMPATARRLAGEETGRFVREIDVPVFSTTPVLRVEAFNGTSMGVAEEVVDQVVASARAPQRLFIAAIGVANYTDRDIRDLTYPPRDAMEFAEQYGRLGRLSFDDVKILTLTDDSPSRPTGENLRQVGSFFAEAGGADTVVLFLASHGFSDRSGNYYFVPQDARFADIQAVDEQRKPGDSLLGWQFFFDLLRDTAGRRLLIVDTCESGNASGTFDVHSLAKRSMASSFGLMTASKGTENSQERRDIGHGIFTYGLLQALQNTRADKPDGPLLVSQAFAIANRETQRLHSPGKDEKNRTQTPQLSLPLPLETMALLPVPAPAGKP
jgi:WD40 repeat protein